MSEHDPQLVTLGAAGGHDPQLVTPNALRAWLIESGWSDKPLTRPGSTLWMRGAQEVLLIGDEGAPDFQPRMVETLTDLAKYERVHIDVLIAAIRFGSSDVVDWRFSGGDIERGLVPLGAGSQFLDSIKRSYMAAAASTIFRRGYFGRRIPLSARRFADDVLLASTRAGSYVFPTAVRMHAAESASVMSTLNIETSVQPFERRAVVSLSRALQSIQQFSDAGSLPSQKDAVELVGQGLSYELCVAVSELLDGTTSSKVDVDFTWNRRLGIQQGSVQSVGLSSDSIPTIHAIRDSLFETGVTAQQRFFVYVTTLLLTPTENRAISAD